MFCIGITKCIIGIHSARMSTSVQMIFRTGAPRHFNASDYDPGFRIDFEQMRMSELILHQ
jgi:hypothetical protein